VTSLLLSLLVLLLVLLLLVAFVFPKPEQPGHAAMARHVTMAAVFIGVAPKE
jgi:hypothetical protein